MSRNQSPSLSDSFLFQEHPVRAQLDGDQLWFVAKNVCEALGILWTGATIKGFPYGLTPIDVETNHSSVLTNPPFISWRFVQTSHGPKRSRTGSRRK